MSFLNNLFNILFNDFLTTIISLLFCYVLYNILRFYLEVWSLPPGPIPLPIIGNVLSLRGCDHWTDAIKKCSEIYGPVFTFWMGNKPHVFITDINIAKDTFRKIEFSGRHDGYLRKWFSNDKHKDITVSDYDPTYEALKNINSSSIQKYCKSERLIYSVNDSVETTVKEMLDAVGVNKQFCPIEYINQIIFRSLFRSIYGRDFTSEEYKNMKVMVTDISHELGSRMLLWESSPIVRLLDYKSINRFEEKINVCIKTIKDLFKNNAKDYEESTQRNICDDLITARNASLKAGKVSAHHLIDDNLSVALADIIFAGSDTTANTFVWGLLFMTYYPKLQQKLRQEIENQMGDRIPTFEDRDRCHYVMAFIAETLRIRNALPVDLPHMTTARSKIADYTIPKGTGVFVFNQMISTDEKNWLNGQHFRPERFLVNGKYTTKGSDPSIPFGVGRRICLGEKLAKINLFLVLVRFLQLTMDYDLVLGNNNGIEVDSKQLFFLITKKFNLIFKTR